MTSIEAVNETDDLSEIAEALAEYGFSVIPCGGVGEIPPRHFVNRYDGDAIKAAEDWPKTPRVPWKQYQDTPATLDQVRAWWRQHPKANPAILTGPDLVVIDADDQSVIDHVENSGEFTRTPFTVTTGRGKHYYLRGNPELQTRNSAKNKLDVRGAGGYVIAPGAVHSSGQRYRLNLDPLFDWSSIDDLPQFSQGDANAIKAHNAPAAASGQGDILFNTGHVVGAHDGSPVAEGGRNNAAASMAGKYLQAGHSLHEVAALVSEWNAANPEPLSQSEVNLAVASVTTTHLRNNPETVVEVQTPARPAINIMDLATIESNPPPRPELYWKGATLFAGARMLIAGAPKVGKSRFALALAAGLATGTKFLGAQCVGPMRVAWVQAEIQEGFVVDRVAVAGRAFKEQHQKALRQNLKFTGRLDLDVTNPLDWRQLFESLRPLDLRVLILDPIINFSTANENDNVEVKAMLRQVDRLGDQLGCAVVLIHHMRKGSPGGRSGGGDAFDGIRGASAFRGWYDSGIALMAGPAGTVAAYELRNGPTPSAHGITFDEDGSIREYVVCEDGAQELNESIEQIVQLIPSGERYAISRNDLRTKVNLHLAKERSWFDKKMPIVAGHPEVRVSGSGSQERIYWRAPSLALVNDV